MQQPLFQFTDAFVDVVAPDALAMAEEARSAFAQAIDSDLPPGTRTYWEGDDFVVDLTAEQTQTEFGGGGQSPRPFIRPILMRSAYEAKKAFEQAVSE